MRIRLLAIVIFSAAWTLGVVAPAQAHDGFVGSDPAAGAALPAPPSSVTLTFGGTPLEVGTKVLIVDESGTDQATGEVKFRGNNIVVGLSETAPVGEYEVRWRTVSSDAHAINGTFKFSVMGTPETAQAPDVSPETSPPASDAQTNSGEDGRSGARVALVAGTLAAVALLAAMGLRLRRSRTGGNGNGQPS